MLINFVDATNDANRYIIAMWLIITLYTPWNIFVTAEATEVQILCISWPNKVLVCAASYKISTDSVLVQSFCISWAFCCFCLLLSVQKHYLDEVEK